MENINYISAQISTVVNGCLKEYLIRLVGAVLPPLLTVYDTAKYGRNTVSTKCLFTTANRIKR